MNKTEKNGVWEVWYFENVNDVRNNKHETKVIDIMNVNDVANKVVGMARLVSRLLSNILFN